VNLAGCGLASARNRQVKGTNQGFPKVERRLQLFCSHPVTVCRCLQLTSMDRILGAVEARAVQNENEKENK
jgi:hypothetical protein